jgi:hypothetical protein
LKKVIPYSPVACIQIELQTYPVIISCLNHLNIWLTWLVVDRHLSYIKHLKKKTPFVHCAQNELAEMFESVIHNFAARSAVTFTLTTIMT